ncbi:uncharacterized protein LOC126554927 [Aphis gossypii]|uniref:uncharacterized protein LOC126554927 n=1 Tax=Aphis gossypii TaxID=80765 RepID=UPI002159382F|nr:uncharacterized protein LOC126554927 [Aphis gossypii]
MNSEDKKRAGGAAREPYYEKQNPVKTEELRSGTSIHENIENNENISMSENDDVIVSNSEVLCLPSESPPVVFNKFIKPSSTVLSHFFKYHPCQPKDFSLPFNSNKIFFRENGTNRVWLTFDESSKQLFCSVCLAFASESNSFTKGVSDWKHLIGKRGLSYRGKRNEAAYSLNDNNLDHGNFLEIMILLSKYDPIICEHFNTIINKSEKKQKQNKKGRGSFLTFLSKNTVQVVINEIASNIKRTIATEVQNASFFSVLIDTTQDVSVMDQCSIVIRYVFHDTINEKLIAVKCVHNSSGKGMAQLLKEELISVGLDLTKCIGNSTDGASNMRGVYNGFTSHLSQLSPEQVHVWCHSHVLNLVICDATKNSVQVASFFTLLNSCAVFFKESYLRMDIWNEVSKTNSDNSRNKRLQTIGETRWSSKQTAVERIFGTFGDPKSSMYVDLIIAFTKVVQGEKFKPDIRAKANTYLDLLLKYETILTAHIFMNVFSITGPLSRYLQTSGLDLLKCQQMVKSALSQIVEYQRDMENIIAKSDKFVEWVNNQLELQDLDNEIYLQEQFEIKRLRKKKRMTDELLNDNPINDAKQKYTVEVHNQVMDRIVESMNSRFVNNSPLYMDLSLLSPVNFNSFKHGLPKTALKALSKNLIRFTINDNLEEFHRKLTEELVSFSNSWDNLKKSVEDEYDFENFNSEDENQETEETAGLNITSCERSFSTLKFIKNRLRNTLTNENLEAFMLMSVEKRTLASIDDDILIDRIGETSEVMKKNLIM